MLTHSTLQYDWNFATVPQKYGGDRPWQWNRGKCLGKLNY